MARKNRKHRDEVDDLNPEKDGASLEDFIVPQKIAAFADAYEPCRTDEATDKFTDARLREFFKAYVCNYGDPLSVYLDRLANLSPPFLMEVSITGEPALHVRRRAMEIADVPMLEQLLRASDTANN